MLWIKGRKTFLRYFAIFTAWVVLAATLILVPGPVQSMGKTQTKSVMVREGRTGIYKVSSKQIRKVKIKYSKKGIARAKLKRIKKGGGFIQITGKKKGKTTITVTIYETKKKCRKYKYKVTVKPAVTKSNNDKKTTQSQNSSVASKSQNGAKGEKEIDTGYTYELEVLSCSGKPYGSSTSYPLTGAGVSIRASNGFTVLYIKTKDPDLENARLYSDKSQELRNMSLPPTEDYELNIYKYKFRDIHYVDYNENANLNRVSGGYICSVQFSRRDEIGINNITIKKKEGGKILPIKGAKFQLNVLDPNPSEDAFLDKMISEVPEPSSEEIANIKASYPNMTDASARTFYQMRHLMYTIRSNSRYYSTGAYVQEQLWWEYDGKVGTVDCLVTTYIMMRFADKLGLPSRPTYAGYLNHYYATAVIGGEDYNFDACPTALECDNFTWDYVL